jgi:hypothetical protein
MKSECVIDLVGREVDGAKLQVAWKVTNVSLADWTLVRSCRIWDDIPWVKGGGRGTWKGREYISILLREG